MGVYKMCFFSKLIKYYVFLGYGFEVVEYVYD